MQKNYGKNCCKKPKCGKLNNCLNKNLTNTPPQINACGGFAYPVLVPGPTGPTGPTGPSGPSGSADQLLIASVREAQDGEPCAVVDTTGAPIHELEIVLPKGTKGDKGDRGEIGPTGPQGTRGIKGEKGDKGDKGEQGETGPIGLTGEAEKIAIAGIETIDNNLDAQIDDNFADLTHNLTFKIPRGETGLKGERGEVGPAGARGEKGDTGEAEKIVIVSVEAVDQGSPAEVNDNFQNLTHNLSFKIPRGQRGWPGETGMKGDQGDPGPTGETGPRGSAMVFGRFSTQFLENTATYVDIDRNNFPYNYEDLLPKDVVITYNGVLGSILNVDKDQNRITLRPVANIAGPKGDKGEPGEPGPKGDTGPTGPELIKTSLILGYNNDVQNFPPAGKSIASGARIPFVRVETNYGNIVKLNTDNSIQFNETGVYSVNFVTNAYIQPQGSQFDPSTDFVAVGFREENSDKVFAAANCWATERAECISGQGVFVVEDINAKYELVNLQKREIYVNAVDITKTITNSYFASVLATLIFQKLSEKTD